MSFKLKAAIVAVGLALVSGSAAAANWESPGIGGTPPQGGDLFAVVYDTISKDSYTLDLNLNFNQMVTEGKTAGFSLNYDIGTDANFQSFSSAVGSNANLMYYIAGGSTVAGSYLFSDAKTPTGFINSTLTTMASPIQSWMDNSGVRTAIQAGGGSTFATPANSYNPVNTGEFTQSWDSKFTNGQTLAAKVNTSMNFYQVTKVPGTGGIGVTPTTFASAAGQSTWLLSDAGGQVELTYSVPVPEPGTWALMAAGLLFLAGMARRRTSV